MASSRRRRQPTRQGSTVYTGSQGVDEARLAVMSRLDDRQQIRCLRRVVTGSLRTGIGLVRKYRHQLAPVAVIYLTWVLGAIVHRQQHGLRLVFSVGALAVLASGLLARSWLDRSCERLYSVACVAAASGWLAAAARHGVDRPLPAILWLLGCALAGPWWWHYRIRGVPTRSDASRARVWVDRVASDRGALTGSVLTQVRDIDYGWEGTILLPAGQLTTDDAIAQTGRVTSAYGKPLGSVSIDYTHDKTMSAARLLVIDRNPLHQVLPWPGPSLDPATGACRIGLYADGQAALFRFFLPGWGPLSSLIAGSTGSGKSRLLELLLGESLHSRVIVPWLIDPQGGQSLPRWINHVDWCALDLGEARRLLRAALRVKRARQKHLARVEWTDETGRTLRGRESFHPTPDMPELLLVLDEAHRILTDEECAGIVQEIAQEGRKTGLAVVLVTQYPSVDQLGKNMVIRDQVASGNVIVFRAGSRLTGAMAFNGALPVEPHKLPKVWPNGESAAGVGFTADDTTTRVMMRCYYPDNPSHWAETAPCTELDLISINAAGEDYFSRDERLHAFFDGSGDDCPAAGEPEARVPDATVGDSAALVFSILSEDGQPIDRGQIAYAARQRGLVSLRTLDHALRTLVDDGRARKTGRGVYARSTATLRK